nr:hypothetical protein [Tanacetum cinerariifolium]
MTLNEYLMYEERHGNLARSYTSRKSVASVRNRILDDENIDISITKEKEEVLMEDVEMDDDVDQSNTNEAL